MNVLNLFFELSWYFTTLIVEKLCKQRWLLVFEIKHMIRQVCFINKLRIKLLFQQIWNFKMWFFENLSVFQACQLSVLKPFVITSLGNIIIARRIYKECFGSNYFRALEKYPFESFFKLVFAILSFCKLIHTFSDIYGKKKISRHEKEWMRVTSQ